MYMGDMLLHLEGLHRQEMFDENQPPVVPPAFALKLYLQHELLMTLNFGLDAD